MLWKIYNEQARGPDKQAEIATSWLQTSRGLRLGDQALRTEAIDFFSERYREVGAPF